MGAEPRRAPPLPAPTETDSNTGGGSTDIGSRMTEKSSYSLPEDGSPVTISTRRKNKEKDGHHSLNSNKSQTSLLIEYFEGGKGSQAESRRPSVRVKVTPSSKSRSRSTNDHIQITERKGTRKTSYTQRIPLNVKGDKAIEGEGDANSDLSYRSATEESNVTSRGGGPIEVEIMRRHGSPLIPTMEGSKLIHQNASDISSMPADSFLDGKTHSPQRKRSRSLTRGEKLVGGTAAGLATAAIVDNLLTPSRRRSRSLSRERVVAQKVAEKVRGEKSSERRRKHSSRSRSVSAEQHGEGVKSPRRRSSRSHHEESTISGVDPSLLSSHVSGRSGDAYSFRSGTSKSSINNPKLLETVEDAIRRLILPELTALKREQSRHQQRDRERDRRGSVTSGSGISRESREETSSIKQIPDPDHGGSSSPRVILNDGGGGIVGSGKLRKERNLDRVKMEDSPHNFERDTSEETITQGERMRKKKSRDEHRGLEAAGIGGAVGALTAAALHKHSNDSLEGEKEERRQRRKKSRSRSDSLAESYAEKEHEVMPPMPFKSDINASELTRSSILSADTERPHSASQELVTPIREVSRGIPSPGNHTPTRNSVTVQKGLGMQHSNFSRGNLSLENQSTEHQVHEQEYDLNERGQKVPMHDVSPESEGDSYVEEQQTTGHSHALAAGLAGAATGAGLAAMHHHHLEEDEDHDDPELLEDQHDYYQNTQVVPPPLRYVPYAQERRGLSPIQSVSGYTEGEPEYQRDSRLTQSTGSYSSLKQSPHHKQSKKSVTSVNSIGNVSGSRHDFTEVRQGGLTDSELTQDQDQEYWDEQHRENDRNRDLDAESYRSSNPQTDYKHFTNYTDDSMDGQNLEHVTTGQDVRGLGNKANYVHHPMGVESAVASLVNESEVTGHSGVSEDNAQYDRRGSYASYDDGSERQFSSSPIKHQATRDLEYDGSDGASQRSSQNKYLEEYDLDDRGQKVAMPRYKAGSHMDEKAIALGAAGAAAALIAGRNTKSEADNIQYEERHEQSGAPLQKSFKERAKEGPGLPSPRHSIDAPLSEAPSRQSLKMTASGLPDLNDPMPEIGAWDDGQSDVLTNPSMVEGNLGGKQRGNLDHYPGKPTPPRQYALSPSHSKHSEDSKHSDSHVRAAEAALIGAAVGAGGSAAIASHNREVSLDHDEEWGRNSGDKKRDTIITNPYGDASPVATLGEGLDRAFVAPPGSAGAGIGFVPAQLNYQTGRNLASPKDEGYISSAPNNRSQGGNTPEPKLKGVGFMDHDIEEGDDMIDDPFYAPKHTRHLSGMSHGMGSPIYDSATGNGIDRIQSKDIIALMDHLTVRDAQRSARDTEILCTLVRAAAEMRNSFEDMKRLLADTEDVVINEVQQNTDKSVQKAINGPRPYPQSAARSLRPGSRDDYLEDIPTKKRNVFRRAIKGLSMKSSNDLVKIEDMLVQLLGEVEGLKIAQGLKPSSNRAESFDDLGQEGNYENDRGYEPEGTAGTTASQASRSGHLSVPRATSATRGYDARKFSDHRISTVPEGDEEEDFTHHDTQPMPNTQYEDDYEDNGHLQTPTREIRGGSAPLGTPPQQYVQPASLSNENTPRSPKTDKSKKHKSSSSSGWIPKISRWSETTTSSVFRGFRKSNPKSGNKDEGFASPPSRSTSELGQYADANHDPYGADKLHTGFSVDHLDSYDHNENGIPTSDLPPEDPKYKAHRNSLNLQHPQPRPGPTHRYQTALESQAHNFGSPMSPKSMDWGSQTSLNRLPRNANQQNRDSNSTNHPGNMSPVSDGGYSNHSASYQAPQIPPKEPLGPERPPKIRTNKLTKPGPSPLSTEHLPEDGHGYGSSSRIATRKVSGGGLGIPAGALGVPARKPTGPRSMSSASRSGELAREDELVRRDRNRDTFGTIVSNHSGESETF